jgi:putative addiction module component (TIGR02574 family)
MTTITLNDVKNEALSLSIKERALLVLELLDSLDSVQDAEIENAWAIEAEKRYARYKAGQTKARSAADVFATIQAQLK